MTEKLGLIVLIHFEQPIDAIRLYLKETKLDLSLIGGEQGSPTIIPSSKFSQQIIKLNKD